MVTSPRYALVYLFAVFGAVSFVTRLVGQPGSPFEENVVNHIGIIVRDVDATAQAFRDVFGVAVPPATASGPISWPENPAGANVQWRVKLTSFKLGALTLELVEPIEGVGPHRAFLDRFGQGLHHIALDARDRPAALTFLKNKGGVQVSSTYIDFKDQLGFAIEPYPAPAPK